MHEERVTIIDVARKAGVSPSTVSHAISGKRKISNEVKHRIFTTMKELDYRPNFFAQALKSNTAKLIGIAITDCSNYISSIQIHKLSMRLLHFGYDVVLGITGADTSKGREVLGRFSSGMTDGILNLLSDIDANEAAVICGNIPVYTNMRDEYAPLDLDIAGASREILAYLWENGHRNIGYIVSPTHEFLGEDPAVIVYRSFMKSKKLSCDNGLIAVGDNSSLCGKRCAAQILENKDVTAIFSGNDQMALGVYQYAAEHGISIPGSLSVVGIDNSPLAELLTPSLTTAAYPLDLVCDHAVDAIIGKIQGKPPLPPVTARLPLIIRGSVKSING